MSSKASKTGKAAPIALDAEAKLRLVYLLFMHQKVSPINYDGFDPGTGHSTRAIQGLMERLKKQLVTNAKTGKGGAAATTDKAADDDDTGTEDAKPAGPKKRGRPSKKATANGEEEDIEPPAKRGRPRSKTIVGGEAPEVFMKESKIKQEPDVEGDDEQEV